ncbi:hypothetical protein QFZ66_001343 [Streptomyces sp. B4I13]|uniref:hypothetical protein n=1 Tax=Streptomyces sp. B4I13 TaxID=3042271 RepID=UPI00278AC045|nr:hypothetical protein [Streptomyces sp. B4I13]MDQ0957465.1 hypothetical protein [Streptomyces sp. B4I13]
MAGLTGAVLTFGWSWAAGGGAARITAFGPSAGSWALAASLMLRARVTSGRVRTRGLLLAGSAVAGGGYRGVVAVLSAQPAASGWEVRSLPGAVMVTGVTLTVGLGMAGLVVAADAGTGRHVLLRRVLDGVVTAGAVFMTVWVLLRGAGDGWRLGTGMVGVLWAAEVVFLGFLLAVRRLVRSDRRATLWVGIAGLSLMLVGDTLRLRTVGPHGPEVMSCQLVDICVTAGLLVVAVGPWVPGAGERAGHRSALAATRDGGCGGVRSADGLHGHGSGIRSGSVRAGPGAAVGRGNGTAEPLGPPEIPAEREHRPRGLSPRIRVASPGPDRRRPAGCEAARVRTRPASRAPERAPRGPAGLRRYFRTAP